MSTPFASPSPSPTPKPTAEPTPAAPAVPVLPQGFALDQAYELCRAIMASHGHTYALATKLLTPAQQRAVWSLYAWARIVDDYVDHPARTGASKTSIEETVTHLSKLFSAAVRGESNVGKQQVSALSDGTRNRDLAVIAAAAQTFRDFEINPQLSIAFIHSMLMDVPSSAAHVAHFGSWEELDRYMFGSAAVIGLQMVPILGTRPGVTRAEAEPFAEALGRAFQVTNFLRDIAEDYQRGRIYLPLDQWDAFGVCPDELGYCVAKRVATPAVRRAMAYFVARNRATYAQAHLGVAMLDTPGRQAIRAAEILYSDILGEIEQANYNVFAGRARVGRARKVTIALPLLLEAAAERLWSVIVG